MAKSKSKIDGGFVVLPKRTLKCNEWRELTHGGKVVYLAILTEFVRDKRLNPELKVDITQKQIRQRTGQSRQTVVDGIKSLKKQGFIDVDPLEQGGLEQNYTTYTLTGKFLW